MSDHIVIVGAGHAGGSAALALRAAGYQGAVTLLGEEPHPPYERPPLSKELLLGSIEAEKTYLRASPHYDEINVSLRASARVEGIDRDTQRVRLADGTTLPYDQLLLTTGARARRLAIPGGDSPHILYVRDIAEALALRGRLGEGVRLLVVGAGFIGLEVAAAAATRGARVTVLELAPQPMARVVPAEIGEYYRALHEGHGVEILTGVGLAGIEDTGKGLRAITTDGRVIETDLAVAGIGAIPNTELAQAAGLVVQDGIVVDQWGRSSDPAIFAAGDVTRHFNPLLGRSLRLETWQNAQNQAIAVARIMAGGEIPFSELPWFWSDQHDVNLQLAGAPERWEQLVWRGAPTDPGFILFGVSGDRPVAAITINQPREMRFARMIVARGTPVDPVRLADAATKLQDLAK